MALNRELQLKILTLLEPFHPGSPDAETGKAIREAATDENELISNLWYLGEHGLIEPGIRVLSTGQNEFSWHEAKCKILAKGKDFLLDDGGISAILQTVTIRLHADTVREVLEMKILQSELPQDEKRSIVLGLRELPAETIKHLIAKLVDLGLENLPRAVGMIRTLL